MAAPSDKSIREAAILLRCLPATQRTRLLDRLESRQAAVVIDEMNRLDPLGDEVQEAVLRDFAEANALPLIAHPPAKSAPFEFLYDLPNKVLVDLTADEHPQAAALVLSCLPPRKAADVLAKLSTDRQLEVVCRIATMGDVSPEVIRDVEEVFQRNLSRPGVVHGGLRGLAGVVRILNVMEPAAERCLLDTLAETDPPLIRDIRRVMFGVDVADCDSWLMPEAESA